MAHVKALIIKFFMVFVFLLVVLTLFFDVPLLNTVWISISLTLLGYLIGDLMIYRKARDSSDQMKQKAIATISDILLAFFVILLMGNALVIDNENIVTAAIVSALVIGGMEWFFHKYLDNNIFPKKYYRVMGFPENGLTSVF